MDYRILTVIETVEGAMNRSSLELVTMARSLEPNDEILCVIAGSGIIDAGREVSENLGIDVLLLDHEAFALPNPGALAVNLSGIAARYSPEVIAMLHTPRGAQVAAHLAFSVSGETVAAVEGISLSGDGFACERSLFNGKIFASVQSTGSPLAVTILPGAWPAPEPGAVRPGNVTSWNGVRTVPGYEPRSLSRREEEGVNLEEAEVIVAAGRGIGSEVNLPLIEKTARLFSNGAVGASRSVCDNRWLPYSRQIGTTGKTVSPKLYLACGISGSQQHLAGMKGSHLIIAVNTDPNAAIFSIADYIIVEDLTLFLPAFIERVLHHNL